MKKMLAALLAGSCCLSACTAAPAPTPSAATAATAETETTETATFPVGSLLEAEAGDKTPESWYYLDRTSPTGTCQVIRLDYATGQSSCLYTLPPQETIAAQVLLVQRDAVQCVAGDLLYTIPLDGGTTRMLPLEEGFQPTCYDAYGAYEFRVGSLYTPGSARRLDLATGQITELVVPPQTQEVWAVGQNRLVLRRLVTEAPLPDEKAETEQYAAALQTAVDEYDWYDPATGALEKMYAQPYHGEEQPDGSQIQRYFLGMREDRLYFQTTQVLWQDAGVTVLDRRIESCDGTGADWQITTEVPAGAQGGLPFGEGGSLRWIIDNSTAVSQVFDLADGNWHTVGPVPSDVGQPQALTGDGRVLLTNGMEPDGDSYQMTYALAKVEDFLAGNADPMPVEPYPNQTA